MPARANRCAWPLWRQRFVCFGFSLGLLLAGEGLCVLFGWGEPARFDDPFVGFSDIHPLFVPGDSGRYVTAPSRRKHFPLQTFDSRKAPGTFRVFCFGGSTVQGNPYSQVTSFPKWLELSLRTAEPRRAFEVINCGGISYASYRLVPVMEECLAYEPDLFIFCEGHNEFLEDRTYANLKQTPPLVAAPAQFLARWRTVTLVRQGWLNLFETVRARESGNQPNPSRQRSILKDEVDPWLDYEGGLKAYHRDEAWRAAVMAHFELNLRRMVAMSRQGGVPLILMRPTSNLRDCPPFKSQHREGLTGEELAEWHELNAQSGETRDPRRRVEALQAAIEIDDQFAVTFYKLGKCLDALGETAEARAAYVQARELDVCPLRILEPMEAALARIARETRTPLIDAQALIEARSRDGIAGDDWLVDHVHPSIKGHQLIAGALIHEIVREGRIHPVKDWQRDLPGVYQSQMDSLPPTYLADGERALAGLRAWTQGRAAGPPIEYHVLGQSPGHSAALGRSGETTFSSQ